MERIKCAIIGSGNIGTDLMLKLIDHPTLEGTKGWTEREHMFKIVFESTSAKAHMANAPLLKELGKIAIDLTPAAVGPYVIPYVNLPDVLDEPNVNLVTCGGRPQFR